MTLTDSMILPGSVIALVVTLVFMFALRPVAEAVGLVDRPASGFKRALPHRADDVLLVAAFKKFLIHEDGRAGKTIEVDLV